MAAFAGPLLLAAIAWPVRDPPSAPPARLRCRRRQLPLASSVPRAPVRRLVPVGMSSAFSVKLTGTSLIVGRLPCCNIAIPLPTVSAHHCRLYPVKSSWYIEDLDSRNGTRVNQKRIGKRRLRVGDRISIGELEFQVQ